MWKFLAEVKECEGQLDSKFLSMLTLYLMAQEIEVPSLENRMEM